MAEYPPHILDRMEHTEKNRGSFRRPGEQSHLACQDFSLDDTLGRTQGFQ